MKVILRDPAADLYVAGLNMWTDDPARALEFERTDLALEMANQLGVADLEVVCSSNYLPGELHLPTTAFVPSAPPPPDSARSKASTD